MDEPNITKKQHYVPRFYLKLFADNSGILNALNVKNNLLSTPRFYSAFGYERYFYASKTGVPDDISQQVEDWLRQFENAIAKALPLIINKILNYDHIDDSDKYLLSVFMSMLWLRSPAMRNQLNKMEGDLIKKTMGFYASERVNSYVDKTGAHLSDKEKIELVKMLETSNYELKFNNVSHIRFMVKTLGFDGPGFANMFFGQKWKIYMSSTHFLDKYSLLIFC